MVKISVSVKLYCHFLCALACVPFIRILLHISGKSRPLSFLFLYYLYFGIFFFSVLLTHVLKEMKLAEFLIVFFVLFHGLHMKFYKIHKQNYKIKKTLKSVC